MIPLKQLRTEMRAAIEKATPSPWLVHETIVHGKSYGITGVGAPAGVTTVHNHGSKSVSEMVAVPAYGHSTDGDQDAGKNMHYIAACQPANLKRLLDALDAAEEALREAREALQFYGYVAIHNPNAKSKNEQYWNDIGIWDHGERARAALKRMD